MNCLLILTLFMLAAAVNAAPAPTKWTELKAVRDKLSNIHQEFEATRTFKTPNGSQASAWQVMLDMAQQQWREELVSGSGRRVRIFDGNDLFAMEEGGDEYIRVKRNAKDPGPIPSPYLNEEADWPKAQEIEQRPCGLSDRNDACIILDVHLKPWTRRSDPTHETKMLEGIARLLIDTDTGLVLSLRINETIQGPRFAYQSDTSYVVKRIRYGGPTDATLFQVPSGLREVKALSRWNAARIRKQLAGKPAPELQVEDIKGQKVALSDFKGKTILLDFWTTWCPPCRADGPALEKLYRKYGERELMIVGISVSEERGVVEQFLAKNPHSYPVVLTSENEVPTAYQVGVFPTYIVIEKDGTVASAVEGDQGFGELRKMLKKAGLEVE